MKKSILGAMVLLTASSVSSADCDPNDLRCFQQQVVENAECVDRYKTTVTKTTAQAYSYPDKTHKKARYDTYAWIVGEYVTETVGGYYVNSCLKCHTQADLRAAMNGITDIDEGVEYLKSAENSPFREVTYCVDYETGDKLDPGRGWYYVSKTDTCPVDDDGFVIGHPKTFYLRHSLNGVRGFDYVNPLNYPYAGVGAKDPEFRYYVQLMIEGVDGF